MIVLDGFTKFFNRGGVNEVLALDDISLTIQEGDFITVIGSNGAGKSTFLNGLAGVFVPDEGRVLLDDADITLWPEHRRAAFIGRVFQDPLLGTCGSLSIEQNMALAGRRGERRGFRLGVKRTDRTAFREALARLGLGLEERLKDRVGLLSGGQRQALTMLMAALVQPRLLLLDEHTAALDPKTAQGIMDLTREIVDRRQLTTLMVTHNMKQALRFGNRLIMFHRSRVILDVRDGEKAALTLEDLVSRFYAAGGDAFSSDRMLLV